MSRELLTDSKGGEKVGEHVSVWRRSVRPSFGTIQDHLGRNRPGGRR